jgi:hypothetical protein
MGMARTCATHAMIDTDYHIDIASIIPKVT